MKKKSRFQKIKNISITRKLYFIVGTMALLILVELFTHWFSVHTLSSLRAFIGAEGLWSKAEKDAVYHLSEYGRTHGEKDYNLFIKLMGVPLGDHKTRLELLKKNPDLDTARAGFIEGRVHPDDIDGMIKLVQRFNKVSYISEAISYWTKGDSIIGRLIPISKKIKDEIHSPLPSQSVLDSLLQQIDTINAQLTQQEDNFSYTLESGSRWLENIILKILFSVALTVEITGLILTISVSRNISKGLNEIIRATNKIKKGDLTVRATVFSNDEIGQVAVAVNQTTEKLIVSNQALAHFAYIASHDLKEPLRKINVFADLLQKESKDSLSDKSNIYIDKIIKSSLRMQQLIEGILQLSYLNQIKEFKQIDLNEIMTHVISDFETLIAKSKAIIKVDPLPVIDANGTQMRQLFQNLLSNAVKFNNQQPRIAILCEIINGKHLSENYWLTVPYKFNHSKNDQYKEQEKFCRIRIKDNGIGIEDKYFEQIFEIFQRLNSKQLYEGTGLGLAVCRKIIDNHNGLLTVESNLDEGSSFILTLPLSQSNFENDLA
jgi:signal transduction histidine kinase